MADLSNMDPETRAIVDMMASQEGKALADITPTEFREMYRGASEMMDGTDVEIESTEQRSIPGPAGDIEVRIYRPKTAQTGPLPLLLFYHGGGWVIGDLDTHDAACRHLCGDAGIIVMAVDYRLAPEHPFPAAVIDAVAAASWAGEHGLEIGADTSKIAVGGDSAGGNLAAVVARHMRDAGTVKLCYQMLWYPGVGQMPGPSANSMVEFAEGFNLEKKTMDWFEMHYGNGRDISAEPQYAIVRATDCGNLPPALLLTAGYDPLQDDGQLYGHNMEAAGVTVDFKHFSSTVHGFLTMGRAIPVAVEALNYSAAKLREAFARC